VNGPVDSLLSDLRRRDVRFELRGDRVHVDAPTGAVSESERQALRSIRDEVRSRLALEATVLDLSFEEFGGTNLMVEVTVPWLDQSLWIVAHSHLAAHLVAQGVHRGHIWTAAELIDLDRLDGATADDRVAIAKLKAQFGAAVVSVDRASDIEEQTRTPIDTCRRGCRACGGRHYWRSIHDVVICATCHPPASDALVREWLREVDRG